MRANVQIRNGKAVVKLQGRFDFSAYREFRESCNSCLDCVEVGEIELDLGGVEYLDGSALSMLLMLKERADGAAKRVVLSDCRGKVKEVLDIADFTRVFSVA